MIKSVADYLKSVNESYKILYPKAKAEYPFVNGLFFRGLTETKYKLLPSVLRNKKAMKAEKTLLLNFRDYMPQHNSNYDFTHHRIDILALMQHFRIPKRKELCLYLILGIMSRKIKI